MRRYKSRKWDELRGSEDAFIFHRVTWGVKWRLCCEFFLLYVSKKNISVVLLMKWGFVLTLTLTLLLLFLNWTSDTQDYDPAPRKWVIQIQRNRVFSCLAIFFWIKVKKKTYFLCSLNRSRSKSWLSGTATRCSAWMFCLSCSCCH